MRARAPASTCIRATKPRTKLRAAPRSPPEAESRLSSLFSGSGVPAVRGERWRATLSALWLLQFRRPLGNETQNIAKDKDLNCRTPIWTDGYFFIYFFRAFFRLIANDGSPSVSFEHKNTRCTFLCVLLAL